MLNQAAKMLQVACGWTLQWDNDPKHTSLQIHTTGSVTTESNL